MSEVYTCQHCGAKFTREKTLAVHMCEQKRRFTQKDERRVPTWISKRTLDFMNCVESTRIKTYQKTIRKSPYYTAFVKFGSFLSNVKPL